MKPRGRKSNEGPERASDGFDQKVLDVRRTARVVAGGRRFSFRVVVAVGNRKGAVGIGIGKGHDVAGAVEKGVHHAKKHTIQVAFNETKSILHQVAAKYGAAAVLLKPAGEGRGLVAGGPIRVVADLAGIKNLTAKILGRTTNKLNNAQATIEALKKLKHEARIMNHGNEQT